jgi:hypothetical protein
MKYFVFFLSMLFATAAVAQEDLQVWMTAKVSYAISKQIKLGAETESRFSLEKQGLAYQHADLGADFRVPAFEWASLGAYYRQVLEHKKGWVVERRPHLDLKFKQKVSVIEFSNRARLETRFFDTETKWRARERLQVKAHFKDANLYVSEEMFFEKEGYTRNRFQVGANFSHGKLAFGGYGMIQTSDIDEEEEIKNAAVMGIRLTGKFR